MKGKQFLAAAYFVVTRTAGAGALIALGLGLVGLEVICFVLEKFGKLAKPQRETYNQWHRYEGMLQ